MSTMKKIQKVRIPDGKGGIREIVDVEVDVELDEVTGEYFLTDEAIRKIDRVKARLMGLLLPSEIKELRMRFNKTQADMCAILALGAKTWTRWETGAERPQPFYGKVLIALYEGRQTLEDFCAQRGKCRMWLNQTEQTCYSCSGLPEQLAKISNDITRERSDEDEAGDIQLLLDNYFLAELFVRANENFDSKEPMNLSAKDMTVESIAVKIAEDVRHWQVTLKVFHQLKNKVNAPYSFRIEAVGFFSVADTYPEGRAEWLVKTNASSVLYSVAREALRSAMATGPWKPVLLPTVSFYTEEAREFFKGKIENKPTDIAR